MKPAVIGDFSFWVAATASAQSRLCSSSDLRRACSNCAACVPAILTSTYSRKRLRELADMGSGSVAERRNVELIALTSANSACFLSSKRDEARPKVKASRKASRPNVATTIGATGASVLSFERSRRRRAMRAPISTETKLIIMEIGSSVQMGKESSKVLDCMSVVFQVQDLRA